MAETTHLLLQTLEVSQGGEEEVKVKAASHQYYHVHLLD
jgi:hypothetical protein